jgi:hypothetical protein
MATNDGAGPSNSKRFCRRQRPVTVDEALLMLDGDLSDLELSDDGEDSSNSDLSQEDGSSDDDDSDSSDDSDSGSNSSAKTNPASNSVWVKTDR